MSTLFGKKNRKRKSSSNSNSVIPTTGTEDVVPTSAADPEVKKETKKSLADDDNNNNTTKTTTTTTTQQYYSFSELGLKDTLVDACRGLGFSRPTPVQRHVIPYLVNHTQSHVLALASTGSGKTAAFVLPILHHLVQDPFGIYAVILTPTRELAKQIHQQVVALGTAGYNNVTSMCVTGGFNSVQQANQLHSMKPHFCVATPGRLAELLRGPPPRPRIQFCKYIVLDEADRLLAANSGFEKDVAEVLLQCNNSQGRRDKCQTLLFSATMSKSLENLERISSSLPLKKFIIQQDGDEDDDDDDNDKAKASKKKAKINKEDNSGDDGEDDDDSQKGADVDEEDEEEDAQTKALTPRIPAGLKQEYIFMPNRVRDAYLVTAIRTLMANGGQTQEQINKQKKSNNNNNKKKFQKKNQQKEQSALLNSIQKQQQQLNDDDDDDSENAFKARSAIVFVSTCERAAMVSGILDQVGVTNVALHSLLSQNRRLASLGKFKSQLVRVMVATDVASRGLDIPSVDLVINSELPRNAAQYIHRVGRTARAGRRGRAVSLVSEQDISLVHAAEKISKRPLEKCNDVTDEMALKLLGPTAKAARMTKLKLLEIGFDDLVQKFKLRKAQEKAERQRIARKLDKISGKTKKTKNKNKTKT